MVECKYQLFRGESVEVDRPKRWVGKCKRCGVKMYMYIKNTYIYIYLRDGNVWCENNAVTQRNAAADTVWLKFKCFVTKVLNPMRGTIV